MVITARCTISVTTLTLVVKPPTNVRTVVCVLTNDQQNSSLHNDTLQDGRAPADKSKPKKAKRRKKVEEEYTNTVGDAEVTHASRYERGEKAH